MRYRYEMITQMYAYKMDKTRKRKSREIQNTEKDKNKLRTVRKYKSISLN